MQSRRFPLNPRATRSASPLNNLLSRTVTFICRRSETRGFDHVGACSAQGKPILRDVYDPALVLYHHQPYPYGQDPCCGDSNVIYPFCMTEKKLICSFPKLLNTSWSRGDLDGGTDLSSLLFRLVPSELPCLWALIHRLQPYIKSLNVLVELA